jgi:aldehyde dehydrogenase (NAD+)
MITPWNWPQNQICAKVGPALAAGCTMVLKPSELAPLNAICSRKSLKKPACRLACSTSSTATARAWAPLSAHPDVDMMSFTGSTRAGTVGDGSRAKSIKKVALELGGKSPNIILDDADLQKSVYARHAAHGDEHRPIVQRTVAHAGAEGEVRRSRRDRRRHREVDEGASAGSAEQGAIGPLANANQFQKVQGLIQKGIDEGARVAAGGVGRPDGFNRGYYVKPTVFADVNNNMTIAREEIFGPVLV